MRSIACAVAGVCLMVLAGAAQAQELPTAPKEIKVEPFPGTPADLDSLSTEYLSGDWAAFSRKAKGLVERFLAANKADPPKFDLKRDYVELLWVGQQETADEAVLFSAVVHDPAVEPYARVLPGVSGASGTKLFELVISDNTGASFESYWVSKPLPDPLLEQVPAVVQTLIGPLFTAAGAVMGSTQLALKALRTSPPPTKLRAILRQVALPEARAGAEQAAKVTLPPTADDFKKGLTNLESRLRAEGLTRSCPELEMALTETMKRLLVTSGTTACQPLKAGCLELMQTDVTDVMGPIIAAATSAPAREDAQRLEAALRASVAALKATTVSGKFSFDNSPLTHLSFGLLSSFAPKFWGSDQRAKIDSNKIVADAPVRALQMVVLNWSPWGYQQKTSRRWTPRGFVRAFTGIVYSPDLGVSAGASFMVLSNIGVNVGYARLFIARPEAGLDLGADLSEKAPDAQGQSTFKYSNELRRDPLRRGELGALFFGVSYNFK